MFDATWGSGHAINENGKLKSFKEYDEKWFDVDPNKMIKSHYPENKKWQLTASFVPFKKFEM